MKRRKIIVSIMRHSFAITLLIIPLVLMYLNEAWLLPRTIVSGMSLFNKGKSSLLFYLNQNYTPNYLVTETWDIPGTIPLLPYFDWAAIGTNIAIWFKVTFSYQNSLMWLLEFSDGLMLLARILLILLMVFLILYLLFLFYFEESNKTYKEESKPLKIYRQFYNGPWSNIKKIIKDYILWFKDTIYFYILLTLIAWSLGLPLIIFDLISEYFYFFTSFDFTSILDTVLVDLLTIIQGIIFYPIILQIAIYYGLFRYLTIARANRIIEGKLIPRNEAMVNNDTGVFTLILGKMRGGKTTLATSMGRILNTIYHKNAFDNMNRVSLMFPKFPWVALEKEIIRLASKHRVVNMDQCARYVYTIYEIGKTKPFVLFNYDISKEESTYYDGACSISLKDAMAIYAESYWIYFHKGNLIASNYPIRTDDIRLDNGHLILWDYNHFRRNNKKELWKNSSLSHVLVFDMLRMGKKIDDNNIYKDCAGPMIGVATEFGKEYGNMVTNMAYSVNDDKANPKNDLMDYSLKLGGHLANIWHTNFFKFIADEQRSGSLSSNLVDVAQSIFTADPKNQKEKTALHLFYIESLFLDWIIDIRNKIYTKYRFVREDQTLMMAFINKAAAIAYNIESYVYMRYGYKQVALPRCTADSTGNLKEGEKEKFYIINYIDYSERFESACMKDFLNASKDKAYRGFFDLPEYKKLMPSKKEWDLQGSYLVCDLEDPTRKYGTKPLPKSGKGSGRTTVANRSQLRKGGRHK